MNGNFLSSRKNLALPPTPPVAKMKSLKHHQRFAPDRTTSSRAVESSIDNTPVHLSEQRLRRDSTDSGLASGGAIKRQSVDSDVMLAESPEMDSQYTNPEVSQIGFNDIKNQNTISTPNEMSFRSSRDNCSEARNKNSPISLHGKTQPSAKYLSTASDRAADIEVSAIMRSPCIAEESWKPITPEKDPTPIKDPVSIKRDQKLFSSHDSVPSLYQQKNRLRSNKNDARRLRQESKCASADEASPRCSRIVTLTDSELVDEEECVELLRKKGNKQSNKASKSRLRSRDNVAMKATNEGISSSDTRRSSIRYEPVQSEHPYNSPSPVYREDHLAMNSERGSRGQVESESETDVTVPLSQTEQFMNPRLRDHSPSSDHRAHYSHRGSSYGSRLNQDRIYSSQQGTSYNEHRQHSGIPRMGTGLVQPGPSHSTAYLPPASLQQNHQKSSTIVHQAHPANSRVPEYFPVTSAPLKLSHEDDASEIYFSRGEDSERTRFVNSTPGNPSDSGAVRYRNPQSAFPNSQPYGRDRVRVRETRTYNGKLRKIQKGCRNCCSWKVTAIIFIIFAVLLLAFLSFLLVRVLNTNSSSNLYETSDCGIKVDQPTNMASVDIDYPGVEIQMKRPAFFLLPPNTFKWIQFYVEEPSHVKFNFSVGPNALLAIYGRKGLKPTHTKFDFFERIDGGILPSSLSSSSYSSFLALTSSSSDSHPRQKRSTSRFPVQFMEYMEAGTWHVAVFNDDDQEDFVELVTSISNGLSRCPKSCNNNGDCRNGVCKCFHGFQGNDCSQVSCAVTCRGNGVYSQGKCVCFSGWKGVDCGIPSEQCIDPECGGHGSCSPNGECICEEGYKGESCTEMDCFDPSCSGHGICILGSCKCDRGWKGAVCSEEDLVCLANCGGHGTFDDILRKCVCDAGWGGIDCSTATCRPMCDPTHGVCVSGKCRCHDGWTGEACDTRQCDSRCEEHGSCVDGLCICDPGWNGELCTFDGCPNGCSGNGECISGPYDQYYCLCHRSWKGPGCSVKVEIECGDGEDNDLDTLVDCQDPDCCSLNICKRTSQCRGGVSPIQKLTTTQDRHLMSPTASFFDRVRFLIERNSVQIGATSSYFDPSRVSVVRGQVVTSDGSPLVGVQVQVPSQNSYGTTKTRIDGWFDLLVNGGGSLTLRFQRNSFLPSSVIVFSPWNQFIVLPKTILRTLREPIETEPPNQRCDVTLLNPPNAVMLSTSVRAYAGAECAEKGSIIPEIRAIREAVNLPGTQASLVYVSSRVKGYKSTVDILLIAGEKPNNLLEVHVVITVQGKQSEKKFEPVDDLKYTFEWDRKDAYEQDVYGSTDIEVRVGYLYDSCSDLLWRTLRGTIHGNDPSVKRAVGDWTFGIHHTYYSQKGVVYLGSGDKINLLEQPPMISTVIGNGNSRHVTCVGCDGPANRSQLLSPVALASDSNGNVYVGDHDFIRKLDSDGYISSLYSTADPPAKYHMAVSPTADGLLYFSDPVQKRIYRLRQMSLPKNRRSRDLKTNQEPVAGDGGTCYPLREDNCGDGGPALSAQLTSPKGLALDQTGRLYFVDGSRIRTIDPVDNTISTYAGSLLATGTRPLPCTGSMNLRQLELNFPTDLAINILDGTLFVLDGDVVIKIDLNARQASLVAGVPPYCARLVAKNIDQRDARKINLVSPTSITVSISDGALFIAETDQDFVNRIRRVDPYTGRTSIVVGVDSKCNCAMQQCQCFGGDDDFARKASLRNPISITATPDGSLYIADQLNLRIRKVWHSLPVLTDNRYQVSDAGTNQLHVFDKHGQHMETRNVITNSLLYSFSYSPNHFLSSLEDVSGNILQVAYNGNDRPDHLVLPNGDVINLRVNQSRSLTEISRGSTIYASFTYNDDQSGLIRSSIRGRYAATFYVYDALGRLVRTTSPVGTVTTLHAQSNLTTHVVTMKDLATSYGDDDDLQVGVGRRDVVIATEPGYQCDVITITEGAMSTVYKRWTDNSISVHYLDNSELTLETKPHPFLGLSAPSLAKRIIHLPDDPLENKIEWQTRKEPGVSSEKSLVGRRIRVNDRNILSLDFYQETMLEKIYDDHTKFTLRIQYDNKGFPSHWMPNTGVNPVNVTYDGRGHAVTWQKGSRSERAHYDSKGNLQSSRLPDGSTWRRSYSGKTAYLSLPSSTSRFTFSYTENMNLKRLSLPSGSTFLIDRRVGVGFIRTTISGPNGVFTFIQDHDGRGNVLSYFYPGEKRKVLYRYDVHGHMTNILHDSTNTKMTRDPHSGELVAISTGDCTLRYHRNGPLVQRFVATSTQNGGLLAVFNYTHDFNLRLKSTEGNINGTRLPMENFTYNDVSGRLTFFGRYRIIELRPNVYVIGDDYMSLTKQIDISGRVAKTKLQNFGQEVFRMSLQYDANGRTSRSESRLGLENSMERYDYHYDKVGSLVRVSQNSRPRWHYTYDVDGKLTRIENRGVGNALRYDTEGRLKSVGDVQYSFDDDGFLHQRGDEVFEYDSLGHLVKAYKLDNSFEVEYGYDGTGRLSTRVDLLRNDVVRFLHANIEKPSVLTHVYNVTSGLVITFRYDEEGYLFSLDQSDGVTWSVVCDQVGTPLAVLDLAGTVIKRLSYSPFGEVVLDSNPDFILHLGFRGGIYDFTTKLVHFHNRNVLSSLAWPQISSTKPLGPQTPTHEKSSTFQNSVDYDPRIGQFTSVGIKRIPSVTPTSYPLRLFQVNDPINLDPAYRHMTDTSSWLNALGFKLQNIAPNPELATRQKDKSSAECQLSHLLALYINLQTSTPSVLVPISVNPQQAIIPGGAMFAKGLVISLDRGRVSTQVTDSASNDIKRFSSVIGGSEVLIGRDADSSSAAMSFTHDGKPVLYLWKEASAFAKDKQTMQLTQNRDRILRSSYDQNSNSPISLRLRDNEMRAESEHALIAVFYVSEAENDASVSYVDFSTASQERDLVLKSALSKAESEAWFREKRKIQSGLKTRWTSSQENEILSRGKLKGFVAKPKWNVDAYPELADSGRNVEFVRKT